MAVSLTDQTAATYLAGGEHARDRLGLTTPRPSVPTYPAPCGNGNQPAQGSPGPTFQILSRKKIKHMTEATSTTDEDEFYEDSQDDFPAKEDFEDRLVAIWPTGNKGTRQGENGKPYGWVETITMALDDSRDKMREVAIGGGGDRSDDSPYLVGPAPAHVDGFQWSAQGVYSRVVPFLTKTDEDGNPVFRPVIGRINRRKNAKKGLADSWSLSKMTEEDRPLAREYRDQILAMTAKVKAQREAASDDEAFS